MISSFDYTTVFYFRLAEIDENDLVSEVADSGLLEPATLLQVMKFKRLGASPDASTFFFTTQSRHTMNQEELVSFHRLSLSLSLSSVNYLL